jgi:exo-beta-1,3-glucanase (GH17 family)
MITRVLLIFCLLLPVANAFAATKTQATKPLQCMAFSPYVGGINPHNGPSPSPQLIDALLDKIVKDTPFRCIMTYGVLNGLEYTFMAAKARNIKVIAILWIDDNPKVNTDSIAKGIYLARTFPDTIIKLSCGSEVRTRHGFEFDSEISRCINAMHEAKVPQPVTTIDTWWEWCNRSVRCEKTIFSDQVDWVGINIFPWWENHYSSLHPCTRADQAADFHLARLNEVHQVNPSKEIMITEFGWPHSPAGFTPKNDKTGHQCGVANAENQKLVVQSTFKQLAKAHRSGVVFEAFSENWKTGDEGQSGKYWGICDGEPPYNCQKNLIAP